MLIRIGLARLSKHNISYRETVGNSSFCHVYVNYTMQVIVSRVISFACVYSCASAYVIIWSSYKLKKWKTSRQGRTFKRWFSHELNAIKTVSSLVVCALRTWFVRRLNLHKFDWSLKSRLRRVWVWRARYSYNNSTSNDSKVYCFFVPFKNNCKKL